MHTKVFILPILGIVFFSTTSATQQTYYFERLFTFWLISCPKTGWKVKNSKSYVHYVWTAKIRNMMDHFFRNWIYNNWWLCKGKQCLFEMISTKYGNIVHNMYANPNPFFTIEIGSPSNIAQLLKYTFRNCMFLTSPHSTGYCPFKIWKLFWHVVKFYIKKIP